MNTESHQKLLRDEAEKTVAKLWSEDVTNTAAKL